MGSNTATEPSRCFEETRYDNVHTCATGVKLVWIVDPHFQTVTVHRPDSKPDFFTNDDDLTAEPHLPGFQVAVRQFFE